jgi:hypothetical protein
MNWESYGSGSLRRSLGSKASANDHQVMRVRRESMYISYWSSGTRFQKTHIKSTVDNVQQEAIASRLSTFLRCKDKPKCG